MLGPGTFKVVLPMAPGLAPLYPKYIVTWYVPGGSVSMWSNAHQDLLQTAIEWGWFGVVIWLGLFVGGVTRGLRQPAGTRGGCGWPVTAVRLGLCVVGLHAMMDFPLQVFCIQIWVAAMLGVLWGVSADRPHTSARRFDARAETLGLLATPS